MNMTITNLVPSKYEGLVYLFGKLTLYGPEIWLLHLMRHAKS